MADATPEFTADKDEAQRSQRKQQRKKWLIRVAMAVIAAGLIYFLWYELIGRNHVSTDNAYVNAEIAQVTPLTSAQVIEVRVADTQQVKRGDILVRLDPTNARLMVAEAEAELAGARRRYRQTAATSTSLAAQVNAREAGIAQARAALATAQADYDRAGVDLRRREALAPEGAVTGEEVTSARKDFAAARAGLEQARAAVVSAQATRGAAEGEFAANEALVSGSTVTTDPAVMTAQAKLDNAKLELSRTVIRAPIDGVVTRRQVQVGQRVAQGAAIMSIVPLDQVYIDANFKERQLRRVRPGMPATITADIYGGDVVYHGKVVGFAGGTGSSMAIIPAQNATGNWIKVVQRLPVRIALDARELKAHPLRVGLSTEVEIDLSDS